MLKKLFPLLVFWFAFAFAADSINDFAYQAEISKSDVGLQRLPVPLEVLLNVTQRNFADIAVLDRHGDPLPLAVMKTLPTLSNQQIDLDIHSFDVFYSDHSKLVTTRQQKRQADQLSELQTTETIETRLRRTDYLLELPEDLELQEIELEWSQQPENQLLNVRLEVGTDLDNLRVIDGSKTLSNVNPDEPAWRRIGNLPRGQKYLRVTPVEPIDRFELLRAVGHYQTRHPAARLSHKVEFTEVTIKDRPYLYFETPTAVSPVALSIIPAQAHSMISATLYASSRDFEHGRQIRSQVRQHNINSNEVERNQPVTLPQRHYRHWWISLQEPTADLPDIHLHYPQYEVLFLGNNNQPYTLLWGNYQNTANTAALTGLIKADLNQPGNRGARVSLLQIRPAGGDARLSAEPVLPWKKWLLWLLLAVAAVMTGRMAFSLYKDMNKPE